jgi:hypothetical protein
MSSVQTYFHDEAKAFEYLESVLWPDGIVCPHCGVVGGRACELKGKSDPPWPEEVRRVPSTIHRQGGTVFEHGRMPLNKMLQAVFLMTSSKKGISAHQLHRTLEITYKSAWFLAHRIREAMRSGDLAPFGGEGGVVEVDETFIGRKLGVEMGRGGTRHMIALLSPVHRESGQCRSFVVDNVSRDELLLIVTRNVVTTPWLMAPTLYCRA